MAGTESLNAPRLRTAHLPGAMGEQFHALGSRVVDLVGDAKVYYQPNRGNWGDGLIAAGTRRFLGDLGIVYQEIDPPINYLEKPYPRPAFLRSILRPPWLREISKPDAVLIYGGGGAWCSYWDLSKYLTYTAQFFSHVIVLPSTFERIAAIPNATFFCRDLYESKQLSKAEFCHDMAFYIDPGEIPKGEDEGASEGGLNVFRTDVESARLSAVPDENRDLSLEHDHAYPVDDFFAALRPYTEIRTDRLHVGIASCLLGKTVQLHPGAYFKIRAVFDSSIREYFPSASLAG